ncbi:DsbA family protein [Maricaulis salignorans]|uniref:DsbA family protein n=1 Tax=Maricaulis salignorans TaxID=144026 RepID=UPI003A8D47CA
MLRLFAIMTAAAFLFGCQQSPADAQLNERSREEVGEIVRAYILENPEVIEEALIELQRRAQAREMENVYSAIERNLAAIYGDERDPRFGGDEPDVTIVEFMDYKCSYCRVANEWVTDVNERYGDRVQFIFKEYPILGPDSLEASRAALAALNQGPEIYELFHRSMINASGPLPADRIDQLAALAGVDVAQMRTDMEDEAIMAHILDVRALGQALEVSGTPFFIVDGTVVAGANSLALEEALQRALRG